MTPDEQRKALRAQIAEAEAARDFGKAGRLKGELLRVPAPAAPRPSPAEEAATLASLRTQIAEAEESGKWSEAGRLKSELLRTVSTL